MASEEARAVERLNELAGDAPKRSPNVRSLAMFAANSGCKLATLAFAARVDFNTILAKTDYEAPFGQSTFAFRRGNTFEDLLRRNGHAPLLGLLETELKYDVKNARVANLRKGAPSTEGMRLRAETTRRQIELVLAGDKGAPNLIDGAVMSRKVGGVTAYFEADAVAARFAEPIHAGEVKSFPTIDGQADPEKVGAAIAQVSIYVLLLRDLVKELGGDPKVVSSSALLITPRNTGLQPTMTVKEVGREVDRARRILEQAPNVVAVAGSLPSGIPTFHEVARGSSPDERVAAAHRLADSVGTAYQPACLGSCGLSRLCRERACGTPERVGGKIVRLLPNVDSFDRVRALAAGGAPKASEAPVAEQLVRAARLMAKITPPRPAPARPKVAS
jgi:hypothetical protein